MRSAATVSRTAQGIHKLLYEKVVYRCGELRRQIKGQRGKLAAQEGRREEHTTKHWYIRLRASSAKHNCLQTKTERRGDLPTQMPPFPGEGPSGKRGGRVGTFGEGGWHYGWWRCSAGDAEGLLWEEWLLV